MKKILFILTIVIASLSAKPCMTDIYFGNGVWNPDRDAVRKVQLRGLKILMENNQPDIFNQNNEGKNYQWRVAFNPSYGTIDDLIETYWQLKESGQITEGYFGAVYAFLTWEESNEFYNKLDEIITKYNNDVTAMFSLYRNGSFDQKHNVLLLAHSQGNLFGNKMYTLMNDSQKKKFRMVSIGTPADHVMQPGQTSPYVTLYGDFVIRPISGSLPANTNGGGHSFLGAYLAKINARIKIVNYLKSAYDNLMQTTSCTEYSFARVLMLPLGEVKIFARPIDQGYSVDLINEFTLEVRDAIFDETIPFNGSDIARWHCGSEARTLYVEGSGAGGAYWSYGTYEDELGEQHVGNFEWLPARITSNDELQARVLVKEDILFVNSKKCVTMSLDTKSPLYKAIEEIFPSNKP